MTVPVCTIIMYLNLIHSDLTVSLQITHKHFNLMIIYSRFVGYGKCPSFFLLKVNFLMERLKDLKMHGDIMQMHLQQIKMQANFQRK